MLALRPTDVAILSMALAIVLFMLTMAQRLGEWRSKTVATILGVLAGLLLVCWFYLFALWVFGVDLRYLVQTQAGLFWFSLLASIALAAATMFWRYKAPLPPSNRAVDTNSTRQPTLSSIHQQTSGPHSLAQVAHRDIHNYNQFVATPPILRPQLILSFDPSDEPCVQKESTYNHLFRIRAYNAGPTVAHRVRLLIDRPPGEMPRLQGARLGVRHKKGESEVDIGIEQPDYFDWLQYSSQYSSAIWIWHTVKDTLPNKWPIGNAASVEFVLKAQSEEGPSNELRVAFKRRSATDYYVEVVSDATEAGQSPSAGPIATNDVRDLAGCPKVLLKHQKNPIYTGLYVEVHDGEAIAVQLERIVCNGHYLTSEPIQHAKQGSAEGLQLSRAKVEEYNPAQIRKSHDAFELFVADVWALKHPEDTSMSWEQKMNKAFDEVQTNQLAIDVAISYRDLAGASYRSLAQIAWRPVIGVVEVRQVKIERCKD